LEVDDGMTAELIKSPDDANVHFVIGTVKSHVYHYLEERINRSTTAARVALEGQVPADSISRDFEAVKRPGQIVGKLLRSGQPAAGWTVKVWPSGRLASFTPPQAKTDSAGRFVVRGVPPGLVGIEIWFPVSGKGLLEVHQIVVPPGGRREEFLAPGETLDWGTVETGVGDQRRS
jgi:hypothetical protein